MSGCPDASCSRSRELCEIKKAVKVEEVSMEKGSELLRAVLSQRCDSSSAEANPAREKREHASSEDAYHAGNITLR